LALIANFVVVGAGGGLVLVATVVVVGAGGALAAM